MCINVLVFGMTDNPGGMESCVMNYRNIDMKEVHFDFLCNWEHMVYADEVMADGSRIYTIPKRSDDYKAYKEKMDEFWSKADIKIEGDSGLQQGAFGGGCSGAYNGERPGISYTRA